MVLTEKLTDDTDSMPHFWKGIYGAWKNPALYNILLKSHLFSDPIVQQVQKYLPKNSIMLEAGCGSGKIMLETAISCKYLVGLEFEKATAQHAKKNLRKSRINSAEIVVGDVRFLPFREKVFSYVTSLGVIEHFLEPSLLIKEMARVLSNTGLLFLSTPSKAAYFTEKEQAICNIRYGHHDFYSKYDLSNIIVESKMHPVARFNCGYFWGFAMYAIQKLKTKEPISKLVVMASFFLFFPSVIIDKLSPDRGFYSIVIARERSSQVPI